MNLKGIFLSLAFLVVRPKQKCLGERWMDGFDVGRGIFERERERDNNNDRRRVVDFQMWRRRFKTFLLRRVVVRIAL